MTDVDYRTTSTSLTFNRIRHKVHEINYKKELSRLKKQCKGFLLNIQQEQETICRDQFAQDIATIFQRSADITKAGKDSTRPGLFRSDDGKLLTQRQIDKMCSAPGMYRDMKFDKQRETRAKAYQLQRKRRFEAQHQHMKKRAYDAKHQKILHGRADFYSIDGQRQINKELQRLQKTLDVEHSINDEKRIATVKKSHSHEIQAQVKHPIKTSGGELKVGISGISLIHRIGLYDKIAKMAAKDKDSPLPNDGDNGSPFIIDNRDRKCELELSAKDTLECVTDVAVSEARRLSSLEISDSIHERLKMVAYEHLEILPEADRSLCDTPLASYPATPTPTIPAVTKRLSAVTPDIPAVIKEPAKKLPKRRPKTRGKVKPLEYTMKRAVKTLVAGNYVMDMMENDSNRLMLCKMCSDNRFGHEQHESVIMSQPAGAWPSSKVGWGQNQHRETTAHDHGPVFVDSLIIQPSKIHLSSENASLLQAKPDIQRERSPRSSVCPPMPFMRRERRTVQIADITRDVGLMSMAYLKCRYLRLTPAAIKQLESNVQNAGLKSGSHFYAHSSVTDIFNKSEDNVPSNFKVKEENMMITPRKLWKDAVKKRAHLSTRSSYA